MTENTTEEVVEDVVVEPGQEADPVATLTADLQRLQAEYANYRKRVERDRAVAHESAIGAVLTELLALLDDVMNVSGHRISTTEVESALVSHESVAEAAVVGAADAMTGQGIVAFVILRGGIEHADGDELNKALRNHVAKEIGATYYGRPLSK